MSAVDVNQAPATLGRARVRPAASARASVWQRIWRDRIMLLLIFPGVIYFILFRYLPLLGNVIAFEDYLPILDITESPFVCLANFQSLLSAQAFCQATANTILIALLQIIFYFLAPIWLALIVH